MIKSNTKKYMHKILFTLFVVFSITIKLAAQTSGTEKIVLPFPEKLFEVVDDDISHYTGKTIDTTKGGAIEYRSNLSFTNFDSSWIMKSKTSCTLIFKCSKSNEIVSNAMTQIMNNGISGYQFDPSFNEKKAGVKRAFCLTNRLKTTTFSIIDFDQAGFLMMIENIDFMSAKVHYDYKSKWGFQEVVKFNFVIPQKYDAVASFFYEGMGRVNIGGKPWKGAKKSDYEYGLRIDGATGGKYGFLNRKGEEVIPLIYDDARDFSAGAALVMKGGKWGFVDRTGKEFIPLVYYEARNFVEGLAAVQKDKDGKWGFIDKSGKEIIAAQFDKTSGFNEKGIAKVWLGERNFYIDKTGKEVD